RALRGPGGLSLPAHLRAGRRPPHRLPPAGRAGGRAPGASRQQPGRPVRRERPGGGILTGMTAPAPGTWAATLQANDELIDARLIRGWLLWGFVWLMVAPTVGVLISTKFNYPDFLGEWAWSTFGRLRPVHVNGVIFGAFSTLFMGLAYYLTPRLC